MNISKPSNAELHTRRGFTLVEMLVGMAITLVMMAAVVNLFANISTGVRNRRAAMEISAELRVARSRLYKDLAGATALKYPKDAFGAMLKPDVNNPPDGYFEIVEGNWSDENPSPLLDGNPANGEIDRGTSLLPSSNAFLDQDGIPQIDSEGKPNNPLVVTDGRGLGDYDDILAMTVRSEKAPFKGKGRGLRPGGNPKAHKDNNEQLIPNNPLGDWIDTAISSSLAEVVWFAVENPPDRSAGEPGMRRVYRRMLLIVPWYGTETNSQGTGSDPLLDLRLHNITDFADQLQVLREFQARYDISVRLEDGKIVPNTLADLSRRENRFAHLPNDLFDENNNPSNPATAYYYPHPLAYNTNPLSNLPADSILPGVRFSSVQPLAFEPVEPKYPNPIIQDHFGDTAEQRSDEDLVIANVLAFDVQVFDPGAPLYNYQGSIVQPSGSGAFLAAVATGTGNITGFGSYADMGWNNAGNYVAATTAPVPPATQFQQERMVGWHPMVPLNFRGTPATYDTWTTYYETDGVDQDNDGRIDQGTNGLDDEIPVGSGPTNAVNGPDDPNESETSPPYPYALKGVQVKLRIYEPEARQIRESTVTRNLAE